MINFRAALVWVLAAFCLGGLIATGLGMLPVR